MICPKCRSTIDDDSRFCDECGCQLFADSIPPTGLNRNNNFNNTNFSYGNQNANNLGATSVPFGGMNLNTYQPNSPNQINPINPINSEQGFENQGNVVSPDNKAKKDKKDNSKLILIIVSSVLGVIVIALAVLLIFSDILPYTDQGADVDDNIITEVYNEEYVTEGSTEISQIETTTETNTTKIDPDKLFRPDKKYFCDQYSAYVFCTDTDIQDYVKMRFGPSKYDYNVVSIFDNYTKVVVESTSVNGWTLCQCYDYEGWIRSDFIFKGTPPCNDNICTGGVGDKPVLYLYPQKTTDVNVLVNLKNSQFSCTYPEYKNGWNVTASPDGTLINKSDGLEYSYLYWELKGNIKYDFSKGFVVKGKDTQNFLQTILPKIGLLPKEYNEFIVYWLPKMQDNEYNLISFQKEAYTNNVELDITPKPDSILRVFMAYKALDKYVEIEPQTFEKFNRNGFTAVEWGGIEVK